MVSKITKSSRGKAKASKMIFASAALSLLMASPVLADVVGYANLDAVAVREEAHVDSNVLGNLQQNEPVVALGKSDSFVVVEHNGQQGYVKASQISFDNVEGTVGMDDVEVKSPAGVVLAGDVDEGDVLTFTGQTQDGHVLFDYNGLSGMIHRDFVISDFVDLLNVVEDYELPVTYAEVISETALNVRENTSTESKILTKLPSGAVVDVVDILPGWVKVQAKGVEGFVSDEFVNLATGIKPESSVDLTSGSYALGEEIVSYAKQFLGTPYVYGGTNLNSGVDCSGFVQSVYKNFDISLNRTSKTMPANGTYVSRDELVAGDLMFFSNYGAKNIQHVGIYCGDGTFIHAASGSPRCVMISSIDESYFVTNYVTAARVLEF